MTTTRLLVATLMLPVLLLVVLAAAVAVAYRLQTRHVGTDGRTT